MRRLAAAGGVAVLILLAVAPPAHAEAAPDTRVSRVLVVALPNVEWADIQGADLPNLHRLFEHSAIGALITNGVVRPSPIGSNYVTLGAGTRATANPQTAGQGFGVDEDFGRDPAGRVFTTRTGTLPGRGLVYMPIKDVIDDNDSELYGAEVGLLGDELARAHIARGVIANGDGSDPSAPEDRVPPYRRSAVAALTTHAGRVPRGRVDAGLLTLDAGAPFGVRLDTSAVLAAFRRAWTAQSVVLVEGSDLVRADLAGRFASDQQRDRMRARALRATDRLVGRLLDSVDPQHDAVMVVGPAPPQQRPGLTPISLRAPGVTSGLLRSSTTRHNGFVNMVDVAPTVLRLFGIDRPDAMEGRRMTAEDTGGSVDARVASLVNANEDGLFRDRQVGASLVVVIVIACVLAVATALVDRFRRGAWALAFLALGLIGFLDATYLAGPFHFGRHGGVAPYWAFVSGVAVLLAAAFFFAPRLIGTAPRSTRLVYSLLVALASIIVLHVLDLVTGAHLEWNTVFGYSPTVGIRLVGEGNMAFAQLSVAALLFAGLLAWQVPAPRGTRIAIGVLAVSIVVMGVPIWGNDFGAVVSALPGFALLAWMLLGHQIRARTVAAVTGIVVAAVVVVGLLDLLRPSDQRTHVGRFLQKVGTDFGGATLVIRRKASENLSVFGRSVLLGTLIVIAVMVVYLWFVPPRSLRPVARAIPTARATVISLLVLAVLGFALNDSGIAIPGMMFVVVESTLVVLMAWSYVGRVPAGER